MTMGNMKAAIESSKSGNKIDDKGFEIIFTYL
jgi:hypothetical protein